MGGIGVEVIKVGDLGDKELKDFLQKNSISLKINEVKKIV